jgi:hypothetical protein
MGQTIVMTNQYLKYEHFVGLAFKINSGNYVVYRRTDRDKETERLTDISKNNILRGIIKLGAKRKIPQTIKQGTQTRVTKTECNDKDKHLRITKGAAWKRLGA